MRRTIKARQAVALRDRLRAHICSDAWLDATCPDPERSDRLWIDYDVYPKEMKECSGCGRHCPPNNYSELCCDCEIEEFELAFRTGPKRQRRATYFMLLTTPWKVFEQTGASGARLSEEKDGTAPVGAKQRTRRNEKRQLAVEIACYWLGVSQPSVRFFDPIASPALSHLPRKVAVGIRSVARIYDRLPIDDVRRVTNAFRKECKPLGEFKLVTNRKAGRYRNRRIDCVDIVLQHDRRESCLLRYSKEMATRNLSSGSGRSIGCGGTLLPESEEGLRKEIAYFRKNGDIKPRAKQLT